MFSIESESESFSYSNMPASFMLARNDAFDVLCKKPHYILREKILWSKKTFSSFRWSKRRNFYGKCLGRKRSAERRNFFVSLSSSFLLLLLLFWAKMTTTQKNQPNETTLRLKLKYKTLSEVFDIDKHTHTHTQTHTVLPLGRKIVQCALLFSGAPKERKKKKMLINGSKF
jgi:hypothetical protein